MEEPKLSLFDKILCVTDQNTIASYISTEPSLLYCTRDEFGQTLLHLACDPDSRNEVLVQSLLGTNSSNRVYL